MAAGRSPLPAFAVLSLLLHAGGFAVLGHPRQAAQPPTQAPSPALLGETLAVDPLPPQAPEDEGIAEAVTPLAAQPGPGRRPNRGPALPSPAAGHAASTSSLAAAPPPVFGAVGVRFATDLATTLTTAIPQAGSADPSWLAAAFGAAGAAEVTLVLDEGGRLTDAAIGGAPSAALRQSIERTLVLLGPRTFTARGATTRLRISAHVSRDDRHDGLHGDVFALSGAGSFAGDVGTAFFALPPGGAGAGRRVDFQIRLLP